MIQKKLRQINTKHSDSGTFQSEAPGRIDKLRELIYCHGYRSAWACLFKS